MKIKETDFRSDFKETDREMRCKQFFPSNSTENFIETPAFVLDWNQPNGHFAIEIFLSRLEEEVFSVLPGTRLDYNLSKEEWLVMRG